MSTIPPRVRLATRLMFPPLEDAFHKGQYGRIALFGGSAEYTGAPFFAAAASLRTGADLVWVFCPDEASPVIKSYCPELMVIPVGRCAAADRSSATIGGGAALETQVEEAMSRISANDFLDKVHAFIVGPGMGKSPFTYQVARRIMQTCREKNIPMVIDADGLAVIADDVSLIRGYESVILTPNAAEFARLEKKLSSSSSSSSLSSSLLSSSADSTSRDKREQLEEQEVRDVASALNGPVVLRKGRRDVIGQRSLVASVAVGGGPRRIGGQGDLLTGVLATFAHWSRMGYFEEARKKDHEMPMANAPSCLFAACIAACVIQRAAAEKAFLEKGRSLFTSEILAFLGEGCL